MDFTRNDFKTKRHIFSFSKLIHNYGKAITVYFSNNLKNKDNNNVSSH